MRSIRRATIVVSMRDSVRLPLAVLALIAVGLMTYANGLSTPFLYDDNPAIVENGDIRHIWPLWRLPQDSDRASINSRPVVRLSLALNYAAGELEVTGYHVVNLAIHIGCALLLFGLTRRVLCRAPLCRACSGAAGGIAFATALLWLVHPLNSQCVNYITQRSESLVALFYLTTIYGLARGAEAEDRRWSALAITACLLGMGSKEVMVTAPVVAILFDRTFLTGSFAGAWRQRWWLYASFGGSWLLLAGLLWGRPHGDSIGLVAGVGALDYALNQTVVVLKYLRLALWPTPLILDYGFAQSLAFRDVLVEVLVVAGLMAGTGWALVRHPPIGFAGAWFLIILAPTSSVVPLVGEVAAERRVYLPLMGLVGLAVTGAWWMIENLLTRAPWARHSRAPLVIGMTLVLATMTARRNEDFRSVESVWQTVVDARPGNPRGYSSLGAAMADEGRFQEALEQYEVALRIWPAFATAHYNKANALLQIGDPEGAVEHFQQGLALMPEDPMAHVNLGAALQHLDDLAGAEHQLREALRLRPRFALAHNNLGIVMAADGRSGGALEHFRQAVDLDPDYALAHNNLAFALERAGDPVGAITHYREAVRLQPNLREASARIQALTSTKP